MNFICMFGVYRVPVHSICIYKRSEREHILLYSYYTCTVPEIESVDNKI